MVSLLSCFQVVKKEILTTDYVHLLALFKKQNQQNLTFRGNLITCCGSTAIYYIHYAYAQCQTMSKDFLIQLGKHPHEKQICRNNFLSDALVSPGKIVLILHKFPHQGGVQ